MRVMIHLFHIISILSFSTDYIISQICKENKCSFLSCRIIGNSSHHLRDGRILAHFMLNNQKIPLIMISTTAILIINAKIEDNNPVNRPTISTRKIIGIINFNNFLIIVDYSGAL